MRIDETFELDLPRRYFFARLEATERIEERARARGVRISRLDDGTGLAPGARWRVQGPVRGRLREAEVEVAAYERRTRLRLISVAAGFRAEGEFLFSGAPQNRTNLRLVAEIRPTTLRARLLAPAARIALRRALRAARARLPLLRPAVARDLNRWNAARRAAKDAPGPS